MLLLQMMSNGWTNDVGDEERVVDLQCGRVVSRNRFDDGSTTARGAITNDRLGNGLMARCAMLHDGFGNGSIAHGDWVIMRWGWVVVRWQLVMIVWYGSAYD